MATKNNNDDDSALLKPTAVVAGGGPAGALTAKVLSERGFNVHVYEAYPRPDISIDAKEENSKAYVISIRPRGLLALKRCGVDPLTDLDSAVISEAVVRHNSSGGKASVLEANGVLIRRRALTASLLRAAEESGAEIHCG